MSGIYYFHDSIDFDLVTIVFLVVGVVLLPVILLILVAVLHEVMVSVI